MVLVCPFGGCWYKSQSFNVEKEQIAHADNHPLLCSTENNVEQQ